MDHAFDELSKNASPNQRPSGLSMWSYIIFHSFAFYIYVCDEFWVNIVSSVSTVDIQLL